jgi:acetyl esterase/lipase
MESFEYQLNDPEPESKLIQKYSKRSKLILGILIPIIILLLGGLIIILILYLKNSGDNSQDKPSDEIITLYNLPYSLNNTITNSFKRGGINYNEIIGNINNGIDYTKTKRNIFDLYIPKTAMEKRDKYTKLMLFVHGGGFMGGNKTKFEKECKEKTKLGIICASMNYNYLATGPAPDYSVPRILDEITAVQETMKNFLKQLGYDETKLEICLGGSSAGSFLILLYAYWLGEKSPIPIKFVLSYVALVTTDFDYFWIPKEEIGPLDSIEPEDIKKAKESNKLLNHSHMYWNSTILTSLMNSFLGRGLGHNMDYMMISPENKDINRTNENFTELLNTASVLFPINHINKNTLPTLCFYGGKDIDVGVEQYTLLRNKFNENNNSENLKLVYSKFSTHTVVDTETEIGKQAKKYLDSNFSNFVDKYFTKD